MADRSVERYALSFTSGGLLVTEAWHTAEVWSRVRDWALVRAELMESNTLQSRTVQSRRTVSREVVGRLSELSADEMSLLRESSPQERAHLMWVAACRRYTLVGEFAEEVVRERFLLLTPSLKRGDFDIFVRGKALWHPELDALQDSTRRKLRQNLFRMLREAGLVSDSGEILSVILSPGIESLLDLRRPSDVRFFPTSTEVSV
ncbi:DUF1819 family protein [Microbacterium sp. zg.Y625]|uniref:DUF1819 family protein n=1 Tax=Microbacterium jiangjiandongii TaxID=3049071 RepID=UPI00214CD4A4|nr:MULTISPECIES: DUF1819 family protein [unclassified Microbacterium]MCR2791700.1 DUF1819 family protein [Microbacterium sp. zg.Y625]WIM24518.1 DUF1819 family protein [Microbacterium sp. zg-Y625]